MTYGHAAEIACIILGCARRGEPHDAHEVMLSPTTIRLCDQHRSLLHDDHHDDDDHERTR